MQRARRQFLRTLREWGVLIIGAKLMWRADSSVAAEARPAFTATSLGDAFKALDMASAKESADIKLKSPDIAENGAAVPVEVQSNLPNTREISILIEKNPHVMSSKFVFPEGTEPFVATRVKVAESSLIHVLVKTDSGTFRTSKLVKVTLGGCGG